MNDQIRDFENQENAQVQVNQDASGHRSRHRVLHIIGWNLSILQAVVSVFACVMLELTDLLPDFYVIAAAAVLLVLVIVPRLLMKLPYSRVRWVIGMILVILISALLIYASGMLYRLAMTLQNISGAFEQTTEISVYVLDEDPAESIFDTADYGYGIMDTVARSDSDNTIDLIEEEIGSTLTVSEYGGLLELADGLLDGECNAVVLGEDYVEIISELDGYEEFEDQVRRLTTYSWTEEVTAADDEEEEENTNENFFIMYMSGIDTTGSVSAKSRSDVNIMAVVNTESRQVLLLSTPRDYYVELSIADGALDKLTHAGLYGVEVSMGTLEILYETDIDYYFRINFTGFENLIDALGGITVYSEYSFTATKGGYYYSAGENTLNGAQALSFARERKAFSSGDIQRGKNQMAVIEAVIDKMLTTSMLTNFSEIMESVEDCFETNMSYGEISALVKAQIADGGEWNIQTYNVSGTGSTQYTYSGGNAYVMIPDEDTVEEAKSLIQQVYDGETVNTEDSDDADE